MTACNSTPQDAVEVLFTNQMTMADLDSIKNSASEHDVEIEYLAVKTDTAGRVDSISFKVAHKSHFMNLSGSYGQVLTDSISFGFFINSARNAIVLGSDLEQKK